MTASTPAGQALLSVRDLQVRIPVEGGTVHPVNGASFDVAPGEVVGIIGETGSGKSTIARALIGLLPGRAVVTGGAATLRVDGKELDLARQTRRDMRRLRGRVVGFVPQSTSGALNPVVPVERQFHAVMSAHRSQSRRESRDRALEMLDTVGIADPPRVLSAYAFQLSGGMAQRVVIAMMLALDPELIVADEPTTGLDVTIQRQILDELDALTEGRGKSLLLITHDMGVVAQYCHRVVVLYGGFVLEAGPVGEVLSQARHPYTRALLESIPEAGKKLRVIGGTVGDLRTLPAGCAFYARCPVRNERCAGARPPLVERAPGHLVATFCEEGG